MTNITPEQKKRIATDIFIPKDNSDWEAILTESYIKNFNPCINLDQEMQLLRAFREKLNGWSDKITVSGMLWDATESPELACVAYLELLDSE